jgi:hypothetical protein
VGSHLLLARLLVSRWIAGLISGWRSMMNKPLKARGDARLRGERRRASERWSLELGPLRVFLC